MDKTIKFRKYNISYDDVGDGEVIIFLHGWANSKEIYRDLILYLAKYYRCISIDLPGFGKSDVVDNLTLSKMSRIVDNVINKIGIKKFNLVGHSLGGAVSLVYASKYQEKIDRVILISPFVSFRQFSKSIFYLIRHFIPYLLSKILLLKEPNKKFINAIKIVYMLSSVDLYKYLRRVRKDILMIFGTRDHLLSLKPLEPIFGVFNNIHLSIYEDVRHFMVSYNAVDLGIKIKKFLS